MPEDHGRASGLACLSVAVRHRIGTLLVDAEFELTNPWTILFGPSGSGKTTILRVIAGLLVPEAGRIVVRGQGVATTLLDTEARVNVAPHLRQIPVAPQSPTLFPHLTIEQNLGYGGGHDGSLYKVFGIEPLLRKLPAQLSGGEAQLVSLARAAMASDPRLLLLDEPFTGLDLPMRSGLAMHLLEWQQRSGVPILSVTHDLAEAFQLDAEVIRVADGRVVAQGPVREVLAEDRQRLLSQLKGD